MPRAYIKTFGCQMNEHDSEVLAGLLQEIGYELTDEPAEADLLLINTCSVRERAYQKAMSEIGRWKRSTTDRQVLLGVTGCVASQEGERLLKRFPGVDFVLGTDHLRKLPDVLQKVRDTGDRLARSGFHDISDYEFPKPLEGFDTKKVKAYVTIMKGCDNACSFCIVPFTRGPEVSRPPQDIVDEIQGLTAQGVREVLLLGQNVNSYGKGLSPRMSFPQLLRRISEETGIERLRFTSPHPKDLSEELIEEYGRNRSLCPQLHLPAQSGSNRVLKRMRRSYTREVYLKKVQSFRKVAPQAAITTDLIVGFPGESEEDLAATLDLIRTVGFDQSYSFEYSSRPGTEATGFPDDVSPEAKRRRLRLLQETQEEVSLKIYGDRVGQVEEVLCEGPALLGAGQLTGRSREGRIVNFHGGPEWVGAILKVRIAAATAYSLKGTLCP